MVNKNNKKAKLDDVARVAGVSKTTVSRVLNKRGYLSEQTIARVHEAMEKLHFDTRISATVYMVGSNIAGQIGQIIFSTPLGMLHDKIGYQSTFIVIAGIVVVAGIYALIFLKKDNQDVNGQPLTDEG